MGVPHEIIVKFENSLPIALSKGTFKIEGSGIEEPIILKVAKVQPNSPVEASFIYTPPYVGTAKLVAKFSCKELNDVDGFR